jgi:hypothetical protein
MDHMTARFERYDRRKGSNCRLTIQAPGYSRHELTDARIRGGKRG